MDELRCIKCRRQRRNSPSIEHSAKNITAELHATGFDRDVVLGMRLLATALEIGGLCHDCAKGRCLTSFFALTGGLND